MERQYEMVHAHCAPKPLGLGLDDAQRLVKKVVKFQLPDSEPIEHVWGRVRAVRGSKLAVELLSRPAFDRTWRPGAKIKLDVADVEAVEDE